MKKVVLFLFSAVLAAGTTVSAQNVKDPDRFRPKYRNISFASQKLIYDNGFETDRTKLGFGITVGRSYILHKNPFLGMIRIGLDATWFDINYAYYQRELLGETSTTHQADISLGIGPSVHVNPIDNLGVHAYFRYNPTFATLFDTGEGFAMAGGYSSMFVTGGAVSWSFISVGAEARWGKGKYHNFRHADVLDKEKIKTAGWRVYLGFRF